MKSISLERVGDAFRLMVFETLANGNTVVADIAESNSLIDLNFYLREEHPYTRAVRINGVNEFPDCRSVTGAIKAAFAAMIDHNMVDI